MYYDYVIAEMFFMAQDMEEYKGLQKAYGEPSLGTMVWYVSREACASTVCPRSLSDGQGNILLSKHVNLHIDL